MAGRPRKLLSAQVGNLSKDQVDKLKSEEERLYNYEKLNFSFYPDGLLPQAYNEWDRIGNYVSELPISELDLNTVIRYCNYTYLYSEATKIVAVEGAILEDGKVNPWINTMNSYSKELKSCASDLGLTINSRLKIQAPKEKEKEQSDPFSQFLNKE